MNRDRFDDAHLAVEITIVLEGWFKLIGYWDDCKVLTGRNGQSRATLSPGIVCVDPL
jgi:hypothetical protein